jgi:hypothetical protein
LVVSFHWLDLVRDRIPGTFARILPCLLLVAAIGIEVRQTGPLREAWAIGHGERKYG